MPNADDRGTYSHGGEDQVRYVYHIKPINGDAWKNRLSIIAIIISVISAGVAGLSTVLQRDVAHKQLRAYLTFQYPSKFGSFAIGDTFPPVMQIKNVGVTPAFNVRVRGGAGLYTSSLDEFIAHMKTRPQSSQPSLGPNVASDLGIDSIYVVSEWKYYSVMQGTYHPCVYHEIVYDDIFHRAHGMAACLEYDATLKCFVVSKLTHKYNYSN